MSQSRHPEFAKLWVGKEEEYEDGDRKKLFSDGASVDDIRYGLRKCPDVSEVYFAHDFDPQVVREFVNSLDVTLEVSDLEDVPSDLRGRVNVILRIPTWMDKVKTVAGRTIGVIDLAKRDKEFTHWHGQKVYPDDEVLLWEEHGEADE